MRYVRDIPLVIFALIGLAVLVVSAPASYNLIALFHSDGTAVGIAATWALLFVLELGAVAAKLATLWVAQGRRALDVMVWSALAINTLSNWIHGGSVASAGGLHPIAAWLGALVYAACLPGLLLLMLHLICARVLALQGLERTVVDEVAQVLRPVAHAVELASQAQRSLAGLYALPQLAAPAEVYPRPEVERLEPVLIAQNTCPKCGAAARRMQLISAAQHRGWRCGCGYKVPLARPDELGAQP